MTQNDRSRDLRRLLSATARAHHEATGGTNPQWAAWYAEYLHPRIGVAMDPAPSVETLEDWLTRSDERYRAENLEGSWPGWYATWFLEWNREDPHG